MRTLAVSLFGSILAVSTAAADDGPALAEEWKTLVTPHSPMLRVESGLLDAVISIPALAIHKVVPDGERGVTVKLTNGDRISGQLTEVPAEPPGDRHVDYAGLRWDILRTGWTVEDGKLAGLRHPRPGFEYGHWANGRGGMALTGNGDKSWVDYEVAFDFKMLPANREFFHAHIPGDSRGMSVAFRTKWVSESWNQPHTCYSFGLRPTGNWSMGVSEDYHMPGHGWSATRKGRTEKLASGASESDRDASEGRLRLRVKGSTFTVWLNDEKLVEHTHEGEVVEPIPYGGFGVQWRYESMGWISNLEVKKL